MTASQTRVRLTAALAGAALVFVLAYLSLPGPGRGPNRQRFERVGPGMVREELIAIVGGSPGDYRTDRSRFSVSHHSLWVLGAEEWISDDAFLSVTYDARGRVERVKIRDVLDTQPKWWRWLGF